MRYPVATVLKRYEVFSGLLKEKQKNSRWYRKRERWLTKNGAGFHYGNKVNPGNFLALQIILAGIGFCGLVNWSTGYAILTAILLFWLPEGMLLYLNRRDNEKMIPEIKMVYQALEIQIGAGIYVTDALAECYGSVKNKRLSAALLDLAGDIVMKADIYEALDRFQSKFDNPYIDTLCITILQALETGRAVELLKDISEQIRDMEVTVMERRKAALDRRITFYQLGVLSAVMGVVIYACILQMYTAASAF